MIIKIIINLELLEVTSFRFSSQPEIFIKEYRLFFDRLY